MTGETRVTAGLGRAFSIDIGGNRRDRDGVLVLARRIIVRLVR